MNRIAHALAAPVTAAALLLPAHALACSPPPRYWGIDRVVPEDGETLAFVDGTLVVHGVDEGDGGSSDDLADRLVVDVTRAGEPVAGSVTGAARDVAFWRAEAPFEPNSDYEVTVRVDNWDWVPDEVVTERLVRFRTGEVSAGGAPSSATANERVDVVDHQIEQCMRESDVAGDCDWCQEWAVTGQEQRMWLELDVLPFAGPWSDSYVALLRWAPTPEGVTSGARHAQQITATGAYFRRGLGARRDWPTDEVCFQAIVVDPAGHDAPGPVECIALEPYDPTRDALDRDPPEPDAEVDDVVEGAPPVAHEDDAPRADEPPTQAPRPDGDDERQVATGGCSATGAGPSAPWAPGLLLGALAIRRRRS